MLCKIILFELKSRVPQVYKHNLNYQECLLRSLWACRQARWPWEKKRKRPSLLRLPIDFSVPDQSGLGRLQPQKLNWKTERAGGIPTGLPLPYKRGFKCLSWEQTKTNRNKDISQWLYKRAFRNRVLFSIAAEVSVCLFQWKTPSILYRTRDAGPKEPRSGPR